MRAYEIGERDGLDTWIPVERNEPQPAAGQVAIRVHAASLNFRDVLLANRGYGFPVASARTIPVSDGAGEIIAVGDNVTRWKVGDRVAVNVVQNWIGGRQPDDAFLHMLSGARDGMLADVVVQDASAVVAIPEHLSFIEASTLPIAAVTAWNALYGLKPLLPGQTVVTLGTGGVSIFALQIASAAGARVIATSSSDEKLERARSLGTTDTINYRTIPDWDQEVRRLTNGVGADHVIETGGKGSLARSIASTRSGGIVSLLGVPPGETIDATGLLMSSAVLRGMNVGSLEMFEGLNAFVTRTRLRPVIHRVFAFEESKRALHALAEGSHMGKIVIDVSGRNTH